MAEKLVRAPRDFYPFCALKSSLPRLVFGRAVDSRHLPTGHAQVNGELSAVMDLVVQHEPQEILSADVAELLGRRVELDGRAQLTVVDFADGVRHGLENPLDFRHNAAPRTGHRRQVRRGEFEFPLYRLGGCGAFHHERPTQLFGAAAGVVGLEVFLPGGEGAEHLHGRGCLPLPGIEKCLLFAHVLSSLSRASNLPYRLPLARLRATVILYQYTGTRGRRRVSWHRSPQSHSSLRADRRARAPGDRDGRTRQRRAAAIGPPTRGG